MCGEFEKAIRQFNGPNLEAHQIGFDLVHQKARNLACYTATGCTQVVPGRAGTMTAFHTIIQLPIVRPFAVSKVENRSSSVH